MRLASILLLLACLAAPLQAAPDARVEDLLRKMTTFYTYLESYSTRARSTTTVVGEGLRAEMTADYDIALQRPHRAALVFRKGFNGLSSVSDGRTVVTYVAFLKQYVETPASGALEDVLRVEVAGALGAATPGALLGDLAGQESFQNVTEGITASRWVGSESVDGAPCQRVSFTRADGEWDLWIQEGDKPLLRRALLRLASEGGEVPMLGPLSSLGESRVTMQSDYSDWQLNPALAADRFAFTPPPGSQRMDLGPSDHGPEASGAPAPPTTLQVLDGGAVDLASLRGKVVMLDFWATWCGPCRTSLPSVARVAQEFPGVEFFAVNLGEDAATARAFLKETGLDVRVALDPSNAIGLAYGVEAIPTTVLIGPDGTIQALHVGAGGDTEARLRRELRTLTSGGRLVK